MQRGSSPFTRTVSGDSVRLQLAGRALGTGVNRQLDRDALKLIFTLDSGGGPETVRFDPASREDFKAVAQPRAADAARSRQTARLRADGKTQAEITRIATAYEKAPHPRRADDPRRYLSAAWKDEVVTDPPPEAPADGWTTLVRFFLRSAADPGARPRRGERPQTGRAVPGGTGGNHADRAELRFAAMPNDPIRLVKRGQWPTARHR
jgi:hypothetical protein